MAPILVCLVLVAAGCAYGQACPVLTDEARSRVSAYVYDRYELAPDLRLEDEGLVLGSCFRRISIRSSAPSRSLELFLSPDQRFLSETLLDTTVSPAGERQRVARETQAALLSGDSPTQGPDGAPITLVEFSDFQCPYCERFTELVRRLQPEDRQRFTLVFKHRPLPMHQWARRAALASICVSFQSTESFWRLEDFLFASQHALTSENLEDQIGAYAKESGVIDVGRMHTCLLEGKAEEILRRDEGLADVYHVDAVPTVFVNGVRAVGYRSVQEFQAALNAAFARASPVKAREGRGDRAVGSH